MIPQDELIAYFENLAANHKDISHDAEVFGRKAFLHGDVELLLEDISGCNSDSFIMLMEYGSGLLGGPDEVNLYDTSDVAFIICKAVPTGDHATQRTVEEICKKIGMQIIKRIQRDRDNNGPDWLMDFSMNQVRYNRVFGFGNNHFGIRFELNFTDSAQLVYDADQWLDT